MVMRNLNFEVMVYNGNCASGENDSFMNSFVIGLVSKLNNKYTKYSSL